MCISLSKLLDLCNVSHSNRIGFVLAMVGGNYKGSVDYEPYKFNRDYLCPTPSCDVDVIAKTEQAEVVTRETNDDLSNGQCDVHDVERDAFIDDNQIVSTEQTHGCLFENTVEGVVETDGVRCGSVSIPINNEESSNNHVSNINDIVASERQEVDPTICVPTQEEVAQRVGVSSISTNRSSGDSTNTSLTNDIISTTVDTDKIKQIKKVRDSKSKPMKSISKTSSQDSLCSEDSYINPDGVVQCTEEQEKEIQETNSTVVIGTVKVVSKSKSTRNYSDYIDALDTIK